MESAEHIKALLCSFLTGLAGEQGRKLLVVHETCFMANDFVLVCHGPLIADLLRGPRFLAYGWCGCRCSIVVGVLS
jgi:hypothetical protein